MGALAGIDPVAGIDPLVGLGLAALALCAGVFALRPEVWARLFLTPIDPRPLALTRIAFGAVVLWNFLTLGPIVRFLFSNDGLWLTDMARARYGAPLGFLGSMSVLHVRSDPPLVLALYAALLVCLALMIAGAWSAWTTPLSWLLVEQFFAYTPTALYGADSVTRVFLFLGMFSAWGEAYSIDSWRARRRALLGGAPALPARAGVPAWPARLMMLQLACVYTSSGLLKTGITWRDGTALYYVLNGDHLYRVPMQWAVTWLHAIGVLPLVTWLTRWWELLFPLALLGVALQGYERDRREGRWPSAGRARRVASWLLAAGAWLALAAAIGVAAARALPPGPLEPAAGRPAGMLTGAAVAIAAAIAIPLYRLVRRRWPGGHRVLLHWMLGRRTWLGFGVLFHLGIEAGTNLGVFPAIMVALYFAWLRGPEVDWVTGRLFSRLIEVRYHPDEGGIRRAALVRLLAPRACRAFVADPALPPATVRVDRAGAGLLAGCARSVLQVVGRL